MLDNASENSGTETQDSNEVASEQATEASEQESKTAGDGAEKANTPSLETLQAELNNLRQQNESLSLRLLDPEYQDFKRAKAEPAQPEPVVDPLEKLSDEKLSQMTNRELIATAVEVAAGKLAQEILPKIEAKLSTIGNTVAETNAKREVQEVAGKYPDFWEYKPVMLQLTSQPRYSSLGAEDLYHLAKSYKLSTGGTPKPVNGVVTRPSNAQKAAARAGSEKPAASAGGRAAATSKELSKEEAGEDAWEKVFGGKK